MRFDAPITTVVNNALIDFAFNGIAAGTPLQQVTPLEEFAGSVLFFASPWSRGITGQNLVVDGGLVKD